MPKTGTTESGLALTLTEDATLKVVEREFNFPDLTGTEWYAPKVVPAATSRGLINGVNRDGNRFFDGDVIATRAMFVAMLYNLELSPGTGATSFVDIPSDSWYKTAAAWGQENRIVMGYGDGTTFGGEDPVHREQIAVFLMRYAKWLGMDTSVRGDLTTFSDGTAVSSYAIDAVSWAIGEGLLRGNDGILRPTEGATRAEVAAILLRFIDLMYR